MMSETDKMYVRKYELMLFRLMRVLTACYAPVNSNNGRTRDGLRKNNNILNEWNLGKH